MAYRSLWLIWLVVLRAAILIGLLWALLYLLLAYWWSRVLLTAWVFDECSRAQQCRLLRLGACGHCTICGVPLKQSWFVLLFYLVLNGPWGI